MVVGAWPFSKMCKPELVTCVLSAVPVTVTVDLLLVDAAYALSPANEA
jgi:hypothetical protein